MSKEFQQMAWDGRLQADFAALLRLALDEDLGATGDWTTRALVAPDAQGGAAVVARRAGVAAGLPAVPQILAAVDPRLQWRPEVADGDPLEPGRALATLKGPAQGLLVAERLVLNLLGRLSGIASLARRYVDAVRGTRARIYDTRKTIPGWRRLEKYAVRCGGGWNHRAGLFEAILIKDNHLAFGAAGRASARFSPAEAVRRARAYLADHAGQPGPSIVEIEVDTLEQLDEVLPAAPDLVLLDNMSPERMREAVRRRDRIAPGIELEASGGVDLDTIRAIAESGVDRISVGSLTHSAPFLDLGLDWR